MFKFPFFKKKEKNFPECFIESICLLRRSLQKENIKTEGIEVILPSEIFMFMFINVVRELKGYQDNCAGMFFYEAHTDKEGYPYFMLFDIKFRADVTIKFRRSRKYSEQTGDTHNENITNNNNSFQNN